jgi:hypothetical protein
MLCKTFDRTFRRWCLDESQSSDNGVWLIEYNDNHATKKCSCLTTAFFYYINLKYTLNNMQSFLTDQMLSFM